MPKPDGHAQAKNGERYHEQRPPMPVARQTPKGGRSPCPLTGHQSANEEGLDGAAQIGAAIDNAGTGRRGLAPAKIRGGRAGHQGSQADRGHDHQDATQSQKQGRGEEADRHQRGQ